MGCASSSSSTAENKPPAASEKSNNNNTSEGNPQEPFPGEPGYVEESSSSPSRKNNGRKISTGSNNSQSGTSYSVRRLNGSQRLLANGIQSRVESSTASSSAQTSTAGGVAGSGGGKRNLLSSSASFNYDETRTQELLSDWIKRNNLNSKEWNDRIKEPGSVLGDCLSFFKGWPRGEGAGELTMKPGGSAARAPLGSRGVRLEWLQACFTRMRTVTKKSRVPTRAFVELFVRYFLKSNNAANDDELCLHDFIPAKYRCEPSAYVSHPWDGWLRHVLFLPDSLKESVWGSTQGEEGNSPGVWLDFISHSQLDDGPMDDLVDAVGAIIKAIGKTIVVFPGDGPNSDFTLLPARRAWCVYEMSQSTALFARVGLRGDLGDLSFHTRTNAAIEALDVRSALASYESDRKVLVRKYEDRAASLEARLRDFCREAFADRYKIVQVGTPQPGTPLSKFDPVAEFYLSSPTAASLNGTPTTPP